MEEDRSTISEERQFFGSSTPLTTPDHLKSRLRRRARDDGTHIGGASCARRSLRISTVRPLRSSGIAGVKANVSGTRERLSRARARARARQERGSLGYRVA